MFTERPETNSVRISDSNRPAAPREEGLRTYQRRILPRKKRDGEQEKSRRYSDRKSKIRPSPRYGGTRCVIFARRLAAFVWKA